MHTVDIPINDLIPYEKNAKLHSEEQVKQIANSLLRFGWKQPLVITSDNIVIVGHGRLAGAKIAAEQDERFETAPCVIADDLTEDEIKAYRLADNKLNESPWDFDLRDEELAELGEIDMSMFGFNLDDAELDIDLDVSEKSGSNFEKAEEQYTTCPHCGMRFVPIIE